jgi:hypothetical protein
MSFWIIVSWVAVAVLTAINIVVFLKLKQASEQMLKMAFPNAKNMGEALSQMQNMMGGMGGMGGMPAMRGGQNMDAQLKAAMDMLKNAQKGAPKRR